MIVLQPSTENWMTSYITQPVRFANIFRRAMKRTSGRLLPADCEYSATTHRLGTTQRRDGSIASIAAMLFLGVVAFAASAQNIVTVAGGGIGDRGMASSAMLNLPTGIAFDSAGNLYIADTNNHRVRKVTAGSGIISTVAGVTFGGYNGDNIAATTAKLSSPIAVAVDALGNIYIAELNGHRVRKVAVGTGLITTVAGTGSAGYNGDNIAATSAALGSPYGLAFDSFNNLYIADSNNLRIRKVTAATGFISTVAGGGTISNASTVVATSAALGGARSVAFDGAGNLYFSEGAANRVRMLNTTTGVLITVAGTGVPGANNAFNGDNIPATSATLTDPYGLAVDSSGNIYFESHLRIRKVAAATGIITTVAGNGSSGYNGDLIAATSASLYGPYNIALDTFGSLYIADALNHRIRKVATVTGLISTFAGTGSTTFGGDGGLATGAKMYFPNDVTLDTSGNLYIAEERNNRVRKVSAASGIIATVAGTDSAGYNGDNIVGTSASLFTPRGLAVDSSGNLYIADVSNDRVRKVAAVTGVITTVAGTGSRGYNGDGIAATGAALSSPSGVAVDSSGNLYIADTGNHRIRKVTLATGFINTVAGTGVIGYNGDNIAATSATLYLPSRVAIDVSGNLYIADSANYRVRKVGADTGIITTVAGTGLSFYSETKDDENILATDAMLTGEYGIAVDRSGNLYIARGGSVRKVTGATGRINTVAGGGMIDADNISATSALLNSASGVALDSSGSLFIAEAGGQYRIRKVSGALPDNYQGLWWNAPAGSESGWGINFAHQGNDLFATWFTYDSTGKGLWLSMAASKIGSDYIGTLYQTRGPAFSAVPFSPAAVTRSAVGSGALTFGDKNNGSFSYILNGTAQTKTITRQVFGPLPTCVFGAQPNLALATNFQDLWWAAPGGIESGWGVNFTHQGDTIFATWFTYDTDGSPLWLSATALKTGHGIYAGTLFRTTGPAFSAVPFLSTIVGRTEVGNMTLNFFEGNSARFAYTAYGVSQSKAITRQVFNAPGTVCQ